MDNFGIARKRKLLAYNRCNSEATNHYHYDVSTSPKATTRLNSDHFRYQPYTTGPCRRSTCWRWNPLQKQPQTRTPMVSAKSEIRPMPSDNATESSMDRTGLNTSWRPTSSRASTEFRTSGSKHTYPWRN